MKVPIALKNKALRCCTAVARSGEAEAPGAVAFSVLHAVTIIRQATFGSQPAVLCRISGVRNDCPQTGGGCSTVVAISAAAAAAAAVAAGRVAGVLSDEEARVQVDVCEMLIASSFVIVSQIWSIFALAFKSAPKMSGAETINHDPKWLFDCVGVSLPFPTSTGVNVNIRTHTCNDNITTAYLRACL